MRDVEEGVARVDPCTNSESINQSITRVEVIAYRLIFRAHLLPLVFMTSLFSTYSGHFFRSLFDPDLACCSFARTKNMVRE